MTTQALNILKIKSDKCELNKVESFLNEIFERDNLQMKYFNKVFLCITEAVLNSIVHGNGNERGKKVLIKVNHIENQLIVNVTDEGNGFNYMQVEDPTLEKNLKKESGRGIHIIKSISDKTEYNDQGNGIQFKISCE